MKKEKTPRPGSPSTGAALLVLAGVLVPVVLLGAPLAGCKKSDVAATEAQAEPGPAPLLDTPDTPMNPPPVESTSPSPPPPPGADQPIDIPDPSGD